MASKKEKFEEWKKSKDYIMWSRLKEMVESLDLTSSSFIGYEDLGGLYWEPLLELIYKYGNILKKTYKLKEIKMDYIRPLNYLGAQSDIEVVFDNDKYFVPKLASGKASQARFSFSHLIDSIRNIDNLNETNYTKECKTFKSDFNNFLKNLSSFVYEKDENGITGYRYLIENIKLILYPLRMLRKSAYRLFSVEKIEQRYQDLMTFIDKNDIKLFVEGVKQHMETELYRQNRNCDVNELDKYYDRALNEDSYKYKFNDKIHEEEKKVDKDDKGNPKDDNNKKIMPKTITADEIERLKNDEEEEDDDEKDKVIMGWIVEFKCELILNLLGKILLEPDGEEIDTRISSDNKQLLSFLNKKFHEIGMKVDDHEHKLIYTKTNFDWKCNECEQKKLKEESRIYCSICDYNMCNECRKNKNYYKIGNIPKNVKPDNKKVRAQFIQHKGHEHRLAYCRTKRTAGHGGWYCNICRSDNSNKVWTFYCTSCDYDLCCKCAKKEKLI